MCMRVSLMEIRLLSRGSLIRVTIHNSSNSLLSVLIDRSFLISLEHDPHVLQSFNNECIALRFAPYFIDSVDVSCVDKPITQI